MVATSTSGVPRQFIAMYENRRCSILFYFLVPGGKWQTVIASPERFANCCSAHFHHRRRAPLLPRASAVMSRRVAER